MQPAQITIITVCYNSMAVLPQMLASVPAGLPVVLVDNASTDAAALNALAAQHGARVHTNGFNKGFGVACNQGASLAETEFLLFLNPDAQLHEGALQALVDTATKYPDASAFNPRILDKRNRQAFRRRSKIKPQDRFEGPLPQADVEVTVLSGSAIFVRRDTFDAVDGFDPAIFLYHEDDDLALRLRKQGPLMYCQAAIVTHLEGHGSVRSPKSAAFKAYFMARSRVYAYAKHGHKHARWNTLAIAITRLFYPEILFSARKRAKNIGFFKGAISAFKDGGRSE